MWEKSIDKNREKESGGCWKVVLSKYLLYSIIYVLYDIILNKYICCIIISYLIDKCLRIYYTLGK